MRSSVYTADDFMRLAHRVIPKRLHERLYDPRWHSPKWHEYSLVEHVRRVNTAAEQLLSKTGIDVRLAAVLHDVGKIFLFENEMRVADATIAAGMEPKLHYVRHERSSAGVARKHRADPLTVWLVENHDASYRPKVREPGGFVTFCESNAARAMHLMTICAADAIGKGWTEAQREQRPVIANRFGDVCAILQISPTFRAVIEEALRSW